MENYLLKQYPGLVRKNPAVPAEGYIQPDSIESTQQLGNFLAQKIAENQPVKVEANPELMQAIPRTTVPEVVAEPAITQTPITPVEPTGSPVAQPQSFEQPSASTALPPRDLSEHEKYWGNKVFGKIPLDQFVQMAGMLANSFNPDDPLGKQLAQMGGEAYKERMKREYEGPNKLLESMLTREKIGERVAGGAMRNALSNFVENWPDEAKRLKGLGYTDEAINRMRQRRVNEIVTAYGGVKGAQLEEKTIGREENIDVRKTGNVIREKGVNAAISRGERGLNLRERELNRRIAKDQTPAPEKPDKTLVQVEDDYGNVVWKPRSEIKEGDIAKPRFTQPQIAKFKTILRNPKAVNAKIEDISAAAEAVNNYGNEPTVFIPEVSEKQFIGTNTRVPFTKDITKIKEVKLPKNKQGIQIRSKDVRDLAKKRGITFEEAAKEVIKFYGAK